MWMSLFGVVLILAIAFFQGLQGVFSALIMCVLSILCAALAFGTYEGIFYSFLLERQPEYGQAIALMAVFILSLLILRVVFDMVFSGNMLLPVWVERGFGGAFGLVTGLVIVGMLQIGFQLLPFDATLLGFNRFEPVRAGTSKTIPPEELAKTPEDQIEWKRQNLWFNPDGFVVKLVSTLSEGALSGSNSFEQIHPDFLAELQWRRSGVQRESRHVVPADSLRVRRAWLLPKGRLYHKRPGPRPGEPGIVEAINAPKLDHQWLVVSATIGYEARDEDDYQRFTPMQVRIVGRERGKLRQYFLRGEGHPAGAEASSEAVQHWARRPTEAILVKAETKGNPFDLVFEVPANFEPWFVEFKSTARAEVPAVKPAEAEEAGAAAGGPPGPAPSGAAGPEAGAEPREFVATAKRPGRVSARYAERAAFDDTLPFALPADVLRKKGASLAGDRFRRGHVVLELPQPQPPAGQAVTRFDVPRDKRLLQVRTEARHAGSVLGGALSITVRTLGQYVIVDDNGRKYHRIGQILVADVRGRRYLELQYWPNALMPERCIEPPQKIRDEHLRGDYLVIYLYLLPPGTRPVRFESGRGGEDLRALDLVAPD